MGLFVFFFGSLSALFHFEIFYFLAFSSAGFACLVILQNELPGGIL